MRLPLQITLAAAILASATTAHAQMRFQGMDTNRDGVITRAEWRGNDSSFRNQDWNGDGILSGDEVRTGARRQTNWSQDWNRDGRVDNLDSQIAQRFRGYDMNNDNRVARSEWPGDAAPVHAARHEPRRIPVDAGIHPGRRLHARSQGGPSYRFSNIDMNNDGWVTRNEWNMGSADFTRLDAESRQPHQPVRVRERHGRVQRPQYSPAQFNDVRHQPRRLAHARSESRHGSRDSTASRREPRQSAQPLEFENDRRRSTRPRRLEAPRGAAATTAESRKGARPAARTTPAGRDGISKASASSSGPTRATRRRSEP